MNRTRTLSEEINRRMLSGFIITWLVMGLIIAIGLGYILYNDRFYSQQLDLATKIQRQVTNYNDAILSEVLYTRSFLISGDEKALTNRNLANTTVMVEFKSLQASLPGLTGVDLDALQSMEGLQARYETLANQLIPMRQVAQSDEMVRLFDIQSDPLVQQILNTSDTLQETMQSRVFELNQNYSQAINTTIAIIIIALLFGAGASILVMLRLISPKLLILAGLENAILQTVKTQGIQPAAALPDGGVESSDPITLAFNSLSNWLAEQNTGRVRFMERAAHDMNSLLASVLGYANLIEMSIASGEMSDLTSYANTVVETTQRLGKLIEDIMTATRLADNRLSLTQRPIQLDRLLAAVVDETRTTTLRDILLEGHAESRYVSGDAFYLQNVFNKVLDRGLYLSEMPTPVEVKLMNELHKGWIEIQVKDPLANLEGDDLSLLFTPFVQMKSEQTHRLYGNGLSLYIARKILEAHQGRLDLVTEPGAGASLVIRLPTGEKVR